MIKCLLHTNYSGDTSPDLRCKACCVIFVEKIRIRLQSQKVDIEAWLESKSSKRPKCK